MIYNYKSFMLNENITQMRTFLHSRGLDDLEKDLEFIKTKFAKKPNYISIFTKIMVGEDNKIHGTEAQFDRVAEWIINKNHLVTKLPKEVFEYNSIEDLQDDINRVDISELTTKFYSSLYASMRTAVNSLSKEDRSSLDNLVITFMTLDKDIRNTFPPLLYFKANNLRISDLKLALSNFIRNGEVNSSKSSILKIIEETPDAYIKYNDKNILVIQSNNKDLILKLGSNRWCIVYATDAYFNSYVGGDDCKAQFLCFNFNLPQSVPSSLYGVSIDYNGEVISGGCQDRENDPTTIDNICKTLEIPKEIFTNPYTDIATRLGESDDTFNEIIKIANNDSIPLATSLLKMNAFAEQFVHKISSALMDRSLSDFLAPLKNEFFTNNQPIMTHIIKLTFDTTANDSDKKQLLTFIKELDCDIIFLEDLLIPSDLQYYPEEFGSYGKIIEELNIIRNDKPTIFNYIAYKHTTKDTVINSFYFGKLSKDLDFDKDFISKYQIYNFTNLQNIFKNDLNILDDDYDDVMGSNYDEDSWESSINHFSLSSIISIYNYLLDQGFNLDLSDIHNKYNTTENKLVNYTDTITMYKNGDHEDLRDLDEYIISLFTEESEDGDLSNTMDELREHLNTANVTATYYARVKKTTEDLTAELNKFFIPHKNGSIIDKTNYTINLRVDTLSLLNEMDLLDLCRYNSGIFGTDEIIDYYFKVNDKLSFIDNGKYNINWNDINELLLEFI